MRRAGSVSTGSPATASVGFVTEFQPGWDWAMTVRVPAGARIAPGLTALKFTVTLAATPPELVTAAVVAKVTVGCPSTDASEPAGKVVPAFRLTRAPVMVE